ncbi:glycerophosphodiester phosphodiesterase [Lactobacillus sp. CBA3605]|uniref:glycerophosphoryl diester phosphodiesterase membrane domain-containing protein n=1 Tax=Lactobacillus sp. CBA3605 TaxID=2099788 RepID=UPI000CFDD6E1|nr:glycerophosphodiester phosphodiesterase [Lactobacillus sp. CBA3605]AVK62085.1 glycerophosphodiester phosphodiesterase [Lactobacillus sp. CBA3605]
MQFGWRYWQQANRYFWRRWLMYGALILLVNETVSSVVIPIYNWLAAELLVVFGVPYLTYSNLGAVLLKQPWVLIGLVVIVLLIIGTIYYQFWLLLTGIKRLREGSRLATGNLLWQALIQTVRQVPQAFGFLLLYFILILPFGGIGFSTSLLAKVRIPVFIIEWLESGHWVLYALLMLAYAGTFYVGVRLIAVLPLMILKNWPIKQALTASWQRTSGKTIRIIWTLLLIGGVTWLATWGINLSVYGIQLFVDDYVRYRAVIAVINLILVEVVQVLLSVYLTALSLMFFSDLAGVTITQSWLSWPLGKPAARRPVLIAIGLSIVGLILVVVNIAYLGGWGFSQPQTASHRGVTNNNGVQNSIAALRRTAKQHPDYIEMDVYETKDRQFVVMHDKNLRSLTGVNRQVNQLTLAQLTKLTMRENGRQAQVVSFSHYLKVAEKLHQKLLIEIKTTSSDPATLVQDFAKQYQTTITTHHDLLQSLSYRIIEQARTQMPKVSAGYILPYNLIGVPHSQATFFTMEYSTLNSSFVRDVHAQHKQVYAWTVNQEKDMNQMMFMGVDGLITDNLTQLNQTVAANQRPATYATRLLTFMLQEQQPVFLRQASLRLN